MPVENAYPKNMVLVQHVTPERFQEWNILGVFKKTWVKLLIKTYDNTIGINWTLGNLLILYP